MKHTLLVDSRDRNAGVPGSYRIFLPREYEHVVSARLLTAEIPSTFYVFTASAGNSTLYLTLDGEYAPARITVPDGNYGVVDMQAALLDALNESTDLVWSASISPTTQRITLSNSDLVNFSVDGSSGLGKYLGFDGVQLSEGGSITSTRIVSLTPYTYILLDIEELNGIDEGSVGGDGAGRGAFCKIPFNARSFEYATLDTHHGAMPYVNVNIARLDRLRIRLRFHEDGEIIDFNGIDHSFTLEITTKDRGDPIQNTAPIIANAASTAAAAAAGAAIAATRSAQAMNARHDAIDAMKLKHESEMLAQRTRFGIPKKAYKWIFVALLALAGAVYVYMKRTVSVTSVTSVTQSGYPPFGSRFAGRPT